MLIGLNLYRPLQPKSLGLVHRAAVLLLAYIGMMAGMIMGTMWYSEDAAANATPSGWKVRLLSSKNNQISETCMVPQARFFCIHLDFQRFHCSIDYSSCAHSDSYTIAASPCECSLLCGWVQVAALIIFGAFVGAMGLPVWAVHTVHICR